MRVGLLIILVGSVYLLRNMGVVSQLQFNLLWPILVILIGISLIGRPCRFCGRYSCLGECHKGKKGAGCDCDCYACRLCKNK